VSDSGPRSNRYPKKGARRSLSKLDFSLGSVDRKGLEETDAGGGGVMNQKEESGDKGNGRQSGVIAQRRSEENEELEEQNEKGNLRQNRWSGKRKSQALEAESL